MEHLKLFEKRVKALGNHYQKYLVTIKRHKKQLINALEVSGQLLQVHLYRSSSTPAEDMQIITGLSDDPRERVKFLSTYYAFQYLHMHFRNLDVLGLSLTSDTQQTDAYKDFMLRIGSDFRELTKSYIGCLLDIYIPAHSRPEFFICSVGTRADQDDIDIGIITEENSDMTEFNQSWHKITQSMLVYATPLHLYLSENVGKALYTSTISDYENLLGQKIQNVVIISELLNARFILGSEKLFRKFHKKITMRYYYTVHGGTSNIYHEGFLRGILGEIRANLLSQPQADYIAPKYDSIRLLKSFLYVKKSILNIKEVNAWDILNRLIKRDPKYKSDYELLLKAVSFLELLKFLLQMYVVQEERFRIAELDPTQLTAIASRMGYKSIGMVSDWDQVIIDYYRYIREVRRICDSHFNEFKEHLANITVFKDIRTGLSDKANTKAVSQNSHFEFIRSAQFFEGTKFWEDILNLLEENPEMLSTFIEDFDRLTERAQILVVDNYVHWTQYSIITLTQFITILGQRQKDNLSNSFFHRINLAYLHYAESMPKSIEWLCRIFSQNPNLIHKYLQILPTDHFEYLNKILSKPVFSDELKGVQVQLRELCNLHQWSSRYFHRFFYRIIFNHPEYLKSLLDRYQAYKVTSGLLAMVDIVDDPVQKKEIIGNYYDFEFLRVGIGTMKGVDLKTTNQQFTEFCDNYLMKLFDICSDEVSGESIYAVTDTDKMAILAAGGHARSQAYDDDYDLIALVDTDDPAVLKHATKIISRMNRDIVKRGLLPHYRMGEVLNAFVNPVSQVIDYLSSDTEDSFIDLSQLLGARLIIGSEKIKSVILHTILQPFIFDRRFHYIQRMIQEIRQRQRVIRPCKTQCNIKETPGGLRDIEATALIIKAYFSSTDPLSYNFFNAHKRKLKNLEEELKVIHEAAVFLRTIRKLYRISEAAEDEIHHEYLSRLSRLIKNGPLKYQTSSDIFKDIQNNLKRSKNAIDRILSYFTAEVKKNSQA